MCFTRKIDYTIAKNQKYIYNEISESSKNSKKINNNLSEINDEIENLYNAIRFSKTITINYDEYLYMQQENEKNKKIIKEYEEDLKELVNIYNKCFKGKFIQTKEFGKEEWVQVWETFDVLDKYKYLCKEI